MQAARRLTFHKQLIGLGVRREYAVDVTNMEVVNKNTILQDIDHALGKEKPPAFEFVYVEPALTFKLSDRKNSSQNPYGHACIRYTLPGNEQVFMNIVGNLSAKNMCNFMPPEEYLFGAHSRTRDIGSEQGGIYMRSYCGFRVEEYPQDKILKMHEYYESIQKKESGQLAKYAMLWLPFMNPGFLAERGNCSYWTSKGMVEAGIFSRPSIWPKYVFAKLYRDALLEMNIGSHAFYNFLSNDALRGLVDQPKQQEKLDAIEQKRRDFASNVNIVYYKKFRDSDNNSREPRGWIRPFSWMEHGMFLDLEKFANAVVEVVPTGDGDFKATVETCKPSNRPFWPKEL